MSTKRLDLGGFDLDCAWELHPSVAVRPERFGALLYHFGTRRLSFLKTPALLDAVQRLDSSESARVALGGAGVSAAETPTYERALAGLAATDMIRRRTAA
ncbi:MAG TPA: mycofactocin biosynthesis chaperone MftB [Mycobacteriales bacterium]|nr:mycofactocin biosynthesis chaperone MftB [Mycobacteriales bacterium]